MQRRQVTTGSFRVALTIGAVEKKKKLITMTAQDVEISADAVADSGVCGDDIFRRGKIAPFKETAPKGKPKIDVDSKPLPSSGKPADKTLTI